MYVTRITFFSTAIGTTRRDLKVSRLKTKVTIDLNQQFVHFINHEKKVPCGDEHFFLKVFTESSPSYATVAEFKA